MSLTADSLAKAMEYRLPIQGYEKLLPAMNQAMLAADCTTVERAAGFIAQTGCESGGLRWFTELGDNCQNYEGRPELGNDQPGDGCRFKGRGPIQVTGRAHYANLSAWAHDHSLCPTPTYFVDRPDELAQETYGFVGAVWYWLTHTRRDDDDGIVKHLNQYCDEQDIVGMTKAVNGGLTGLDVRTRLWKQALALGDAIVPSRDITPPPRPNMSPRPDWSGDPTFLPEVLRMFGVDPQEYEGWKGRGHGDFGHIWGVVWHHTGNRDETPETIAHHPALGLAANIHIGPTGVVTLTGAGVAWHAGEGIYPGIREDAANQVTIGIECAWPPWVGGRPNMNAIWPAAQVDAMINVGAAITWFLNIPVDHNIAHKEWAGADNPMGINKQGKPDPANFDMNWFRQQIATRLKTGPAEGDDDFMSALTPDEQRALYNEVMKKCPSRSFLADDGELLDTQLGFVLNTDGNGWNILNAIGVLCGVQSSIDDFTRVAKGDWPEGSYVEDNEWLQQYGREFAKAIVPLAGVLKLLVPSAQPKDES